jgi:4-amino-4-deoxy-L-arabinose transferase-like glycosyltransferase
MAPAFHRDSKGEADRADLYFSKAPYISMGYALATGVVGLSETRIRALAIALTLIGGLLLYHLLRRNGGDRTALLGLLLYAACPMTLIYGDMGEHYLPMGVALLLAGVGVQAYLNERCGWLCLLLASVPLAFSATHLTPFFVMALFVVVWAVERSFRRAVAVALAASLPWCLTFGFHLYLVNEVWGDLTYISGRAGARGLATAFATRENPINEVFRNLTERIGYPILVLAAIALVQAWRRRGESREERSRLALALIAAGTFIGITLQFFELVAVHRYAFHQFMPLFAFVAAPAFGRLWSGEKRWIRGCGCILVIACLAMGVHRARRFEPADEYEVALAALAREAGAKNGPDAPLLLIVHKNLMGARMSVQYYSDMKFTRIQKDLLANVNPADYKAVIGTQCNEVIPTLIEEYGYRPEYFVLKAPRNRKGRTTDLFLYLEPPPSL